MPRFDGEAGLLGDAGVGPDADGHHHEVGRDDRAVGQLDAFDLARRGSPW